MEKPFSILEKKPLAAPYDDMEEIVLATLNSMQFRNLTYVDSPKTIQATKEDQQIWGGQQFRKVFAIEVVWTEDTTPPEQFQQIQNENEFVQPLLVTIKLKDLRSQGQNESFELCKSFWNQLKERAASTSEAAKHRKKPTEHGSAAWATVAELEKEGYLHEKSSGNLSTRFLLGAFKDNTVSVPKEFTEAHAIVVGPSGSGKSRTIFIPNLIERPETSAVVTEVTAQETTNPPVYRLTSGYRQSIGQKVFYLNPADLDNSTRFNPIDFIHGLGDAIYYAHLIITNTTEKSHIGDQIWKQAETHLLTALLLYVWGLGGKKKSEEGGLANLGHIRSLLRIGPLALNKLIRSSGIKDAQNAFDEFVRNSSPNFRLGVFSGLIQRLNPWLIPRLVKLTEVSDFTEEELRDNLFTFYLSYPVHRTEYKPLMALALNFITKLGMRQKFVHPITLLLDEFAAYGQIPGIEDLLATIRNNEIGIVLGFQDQEQLLKPYSQHEVNVMLANTNTKIFFATGSPKSQQYISQLLSRETRVKKQISSSGHITKQTYGAPLMEPGEIGTRIKKDEVLVVRDTRNPLIIKTAATGKYNSYETDFPVPQKPKKLVDPKIFDDVEEASQILFSETKAEQQTKRYEKLWKAKKKAEDLLEEAKKQGISESKIKTLQKQVDEATVVYDAFIAPEPDGIMQEENEDEEMELIPQKKPKKDKPGPASTDTKPLSKPTIVKPKTDDSQSATASTDTNSQEQESKKAGNNDSDDDPYKNMYLDDGKDPFAEFYEDS